MITLSERIAAERCIISPIRNATRKYIPLSQRLSYPSLATRKYILTRAHIHAHLRAHSRVIYLLISPISDLSFRVVLPYAFFPLISIWLSCLLETSKDGKQD
jgi:hypothetical protein